MGSYINRTKNKYDRRCIVRSARGRLCPNRYFEDRTFSRRRCKIKYYVAWRHVLDRVRPTPCPRIDCWFKSKWPLKRQHLLLDGRQLTHLGNSFSSLAFQLWSRRS